MTPSQELQRKPRSPKCVRQATGRPSGCASAAGPHRCLERLGTVDHPGNAKAVGAHTEALGPESLLQGHGHGAVVCQRPENPLGFGWLLDRHHDVEALRCVIAIRWCVATQQELLTEVEPRVDDLVAHFRWSLLRTGGFAIRHREHDPAAENFGVDAVSFAALALEMQMRAGMHDVELRWLVRCQVFAARRALRSACRARNSGVRFSPKSSASKTGRISTSSLPLRNGERRIHSMASSIDFTCHSQNPAISSLVSVKGPSITLLLPAPNLTRTPCALALSPSAESSTPAFTSSSLNRPISVRSSVLGSTPASESFVALTITMTRMARSFVGFEWQRPAGADLVAARGCCSPGTTTNGTRRNRQSTRALPGRGLSS